MFKNFNRDDLEDLWKIVKSRFKKTDPVDDMDNLLLHTLNTMFELHVEDTIWTYQQGLTKVKNWKLYDSCRHFLGWAVVSQEAPSAENAATTEVVPELNLEKEATAMGPLVNKKAPQERPNNNQLSQQVSTLQAQVTGEERIKAAFEEFKKYEDDRVNSRCAEMDARLDALSIDFDEELYPYMLTAIIGHRWVIGHSLHLVVIKCAESTELKQAFSDAVTAGIAKGLEVPSIRSAGEVEGCPYRLDHGILILESDSGEDAPQWIRELRPSSSQLKIPIYPEVRNPKDPWSFKEEILLEDAIAANISRAEKKKKCRVVCRTHGVGFAHHARSDGVLVSVLTAAPQGLAILLEDAATQTEISEDEASLRLLRSKSLPPMYNLDWP
ncbi:hypothetical protein Tco_0528789 [Tanacetum coccineum]